MAYSSAPMYSMGTSQRGDELKAMSYMNDPGPGTYNYREEKQSRKTAPSWRMGSSHRAPLYTGTKTPGPGEYDVREKKIIGPKYSMPKAKKDFEFRTGMGVGPGSYNPDKVPNRPPSYTFGYKAGDDGGDRAKTPGPGAYPLRSTLNSSAPKFTKSTRDELYKGHLGPGPGKYFNPDVDSSTQHFFSPKWRFGTSTRDDLYIDSLRAAPGPGKYDTQSSIRTNKGFSLVPKRPIQAKVTADETPGPGHYKQAIDPLRNTAPAFR